MSGKPDLAKLTWKLYNHAMKLAEELDEVVDEDERKWRYDVLTKLVSPLVKLLEIIMEEGEISEDDLVKILSGLSSKGLLSKVVIRDRFEDTRQFLRLCIKFFEERGMIDKVEEFKQLLRECDELEVRVKSIIQNLND